MSKEAMKLALDALQKIYIAPEHEEYIRVWWPACEEAITALQKALANEALERMAENARELGLDYGTSAGTQVSKVWWDGEKLMAKPIPLEEFYKPAQRTWVGLTDDEIIDVIHPLVMADMADEATDYEIARAIEAKLKEKNT